MTIRDTGCEDCRRITSGDCGKHGPVYYGASNTINMPVCPHGNHPMGCLWCSSIGPQHPLHERVRQLEADLAQARAEREEWIRRAEQMQCVLLDVLDGYADYLRGLPAIAQAAPAQGNEA